MNKVFITGASGMVGSHLAEFLLANTDWEIYCLLRWRSPLDNLTQVLPYVNRKERVHFVYGDLTDATSLDRVVKQIVPDYVFHLAAQSFPQVSFDSASATYETNVLGTEHLLAALKQHSPKAQIHVCSSSEVFGRVPKEFVPINEDCRFHPASPYAISKVGTDLVGQFYAEAYEMNVYITRMFTHTGPRRGDVFAESTFAKQIAMIERGFQEPAIQVGNLDSLRTFADVRDAVRAYYMLLTSDLKPGSVFNIGGTYSCTVGEMLNFLISLSTVNDIKVQEDPERLRPIDADLQVPDCSAFKAATGWEPEISFEKTMRDLLDYWRERIALSGEMVNR